MTEHNDLDNHGLLLEIIARLADLNDILAEAAKRKMVLSIVVYPYLMKNAYDSDTVPFSKLRVNHTGTRQA